MKIFLSHAAESKELVRRIADHLPKHVRIWLDKDEMPTGVRFGKQIEAAIDGECDFLVVFVDQHAIASEWVRNEVAWALARENDLQRPFLLPLLLADVGEAIGRIGPLHDRLYLTAFEHSDEGLREAAQRLADELFALASRLVESLRDEGRHTLLQEFAAELNAFKQAAFLWTAALGNSLTVLSTNPAAHQRLADVVENYNKVSDVFIPRLSQHSDRLTGAWRAYRGLCNDTRALIDFIENGVYRAALFALNEIHEMVNRLDTDGGADAAALAEMQARKDDLLGRAQAALEKMSRQSTELIAELEREL